MNQVSEAWATVDDLPDSIGDARAVRPDVIESALMFASDVLFNLTGRRWPGHATDRYRPCCQCDAPANCGCAGLAAVELPNRPVVSVTQVKVDGSVVSPSEYELRDARRIVAVRQPSGLRRSWIWCQDLSRPTTDPGTWEITYVWGARPPAAGITAAAILGWEFALAWTPALLGQCRLPKRVTSITRNGMTVATIDPLTLFDKGLTGVPEVDVWTKSLEYGTSKGGARVLIPGAQRKATRVTT